MPFKLPLRVLLVEDSPYIRERLVDLLAEPGRIEIIGHADTEEARGRRSSATSRGTCSCSTCSSSAARGSACCARSRPRGARTRKVIVLTNYAFPQYRERSIALGADYFFDKAREYHRVRDVLDGLLGTPLSEAR